METHLHGPNGRVPNSALPLLIHREAVPGGEVEDRFRATGWTNGWSQGGIYDFTHFHSTSHEVLGCAAGWIEVEFFGPGGLAARLEAGDVAVLPAGVGHRQLGASPDVVVVGGYPEGRDWDLLRPERLSEEEAREATRRIAALPVPGRDPVTGEPMEAWLSPR